ncbi:hypothetical protein FRC09_003240 [Ceratobasidium sp. 395]|nr:hypothetical protein FRC09_003240 [Ceratobasidium sp. 395]
MSRKRPSDDIFGPLYDTSLNISNNAPRASTSAAASSSQELAPQPSRSTKKSRTNPEKTASASPRHADFTERSDKIAKTRFILDYFDQHDKYKLGDFLEDLLDPATFKELEKKHKLALSKWLAGSTRRGTRPAEIVNAMYRHPSTIRRESNNVVRASFSDLGPPPNPPSFANGHPKEVSLLPPVDDLPKYRVNSREGLEELMVRGTLYLVDQEAQDLVDADSGLPRGAGAGWSNIETLSSPEYEQSIRHTAPVIWAIFSTIVLNRDTTKSAAREDKGEKKNRNPIPGMMMALLILVTLRNGLVNFFQTVLSIFLFACNTPKLVYRAMSRMGISKSSSTVHTHLLALGRSSIAALKALGRRAYESATGRTKGPGRYFLLVFDNVNKYLPARRQTVGVKSQMRNGTAATAIVLEDVPDGAFDPKPYWKNKSEQRRQNLTTQELLDDIDPVHLEALGTALVMRILLNYIDSLPGSLREEVESRFKDSDWYAKHRLKLRKSTTMSMGTSAIDESTVGGVSEILHDLVSTQMEMEPEWFKELLLIVCGDQLTIDRLRKVIRYKATESSIYESRSWAIPLIQLWHMKVAYLTSVYKTHWFPKVNSSLFGLRQSMHTLGRNVNPDQPNSYYIWHDGVKTTFETMVLTATYTILQEMAGKPADHTDHVTNELTKHFAPGGLFPDCSFQQLERIANQVYTHYMTTQAYQATLGKPSQPANASSMEAIVFEELRKLREESGPDATTNADQLLGNSVLFMRDAFWYLEFASAVPEGDIGRVCEIIKLLRFSFWGSGSSNYGSELLSLACDFRYEFPEELKLAILNNYLVNPSGLPGHWQECDFFQEHCNKAIKVVFNSKNSEWDSKFLRDAVSVNISGLARLRELMMEFLGLRRTPKGRAQRDYAADINVLASHYLRGQMFQLTLGRAQDCVAADMFEAGYNKLESGALARFLARTKLNRAGQASGPVADPEEKDEGQEVEVPHQPLIMENGRLVEGESSDEEDDI